MKKLYLWLYAIMLFTALYSCSYLSDDGGDPDAPDGCFRISIRDADTHENLVGNGDKIYHIDSLKLTNFKGEKRYLKFIKYDNFAAGRYKNEYLIDIIFDAFNSWKVFNQTYGEKFDTTLLLYYNQYDTDTIRFVRSKNEVSIYKNNLLLTERDTVPATYILPKTKQEQELSKP